MVTNVGHTTEDSASKSIEPDTDIRRTIPIDSDKTKKVSLSVILPEAVVTAVPGHGEKIVKKSWSNTSSTL